MAVFTIKRRSGEAFEVLVDDGDLTSVLAAGPWSILPMGDTWYVKRHPAQEGLPRTELLHRFLTGVASMDVDHINRNGLDNRRGNLRVCTTSQNMGNMRKPRTNASGIKGVSKARRGEGWRARVCVGGRSIELGTFDTKEEAAEAYRKGARAAFGEFARFA